jgi:hypothetical protein
MSVIAQKRDMAGRNFETPFNGILNFTIIKGTGLHPVPTLQLIQRRFIFRPAAFTPTTFFLRAKFDAQLNIFSGRRGTPRQKATINPNSPAPEDFDALPGQGDHSFDHEGLFILGRMKYHDITSPRPFLTLMYPCRRKRPTDSIRKFIDQNEIKLTQGGPHTPRRYDVGFKCDPTQEQNQTDGTQNRRNRLEPSTSLILRWAFRLIRHCTS